MVIEDGGVATDTRLADVNMEDRVFGALASLTVSLILNPVGKVDPEAQGILDELIQYWNEKGLQPKEIETLLQWMSENNVKGTELVRLLADEDGGNGTISGLGLYIIDGPERSSKNEAERVREEHFSVIQKEFVGDDTVFTFMVSAIYGWAEDSLVQSGMEKEAEDFTVLSSIVDGVIRKWGKTAQELDEEVVSKGDGGSENPLFDILNDMGIEHDSDIRKQREEIILDLSGTLRTKFCDPKAATDKDLQVKMLKDISSALDSIYTKSTSITPLRAFLIMQACSMNGDVREDIMTHYREEKEANEWAVLYGEQLSLVGDFYPRARKLLDSEKRTRRKDATAPLIGLILTLCMDPLTDLCKKYGFLKDKPDSAQSD